MRKLLYFFILLHVAFVCSCHENTDTNSARSSMGNNFTDTTGKVIKTNEQWKKQLGEESYYILRNKGTERAFTGKYNKHKEKGMYLCKGCGYLLFSSTSKFDSGTGWPSFYEPIDKENIKEIKDRSYGMIRTEVLCNRCDGHLGHVFADGPKPTGLRYCINSASLDFRKD